jgi:Uma2 family endonuclease
MVSVEEYLTTNYEADREYVDGELLERHSAEQPHSRVHGVVASLLFQKEREAGVRVLMSQRVQVSPTRFRVPDAQSSQRETVGLFSDGRSLRLGA